MQKSSMRYLPVARMMAYSADLHALAILLEQLCNVRKIDVVK